MIYEYIYNIYIYIYIYIIIYIYIYKYIFILYTFILCYTDGNHYITVTKCTNLLETKETILKDPIKSY